MTMNAEHSQNEANNRQGRIKRLFTQIRCHRPIYPIRPHKPLTAQRRRKVRQPPMDHREHTAQPP
jgi:hypothetical protein